MASYLSDRKNQPSVVSPFGKLVLMANDITDDYEILKGTILGIGAYAKACACKSKKSKDLQ